MSLPINPNSSSIPNITPTGPGPAGFTPLEKLLIDAFTPSIGEVLPTPPVDASNPQITMAEFFSSVSSAQLKQKLQDYLNQITDPLLRQKLLDEVVNRSIAIADVITLIVEYRELLFKLDEINLKGKQQNLNNAINDYNTNNGQDSTNINAMNDAIDSYTTAQNNYQSALSTYQSALTTFTSAQNTYDSALATWNAALNAFNAGTITQSQLNSAKSTFDTAKATFTSAQGTMNNATNSFNSAKNDWLAAQSDLDAATATYNTYVASRDSELDAATKDYNKAIQKALPILTDMANILTFLFGSSFLVNPSEYTGAGLPTFDQNSPPPGPNTLRDGVQATLDGSNSSTANINVLISQITSIMTTINSGGYTPPPTLTPPPTVSDIADLPTENSNYNLSHLSYTPPTTNTFNFDALTEFDTNFLTVMLQAVDEYNKTSEKEDRFQKQFTDVIAQFIVNTLPNESVGVGSSVSVTSNQVTGTRSNPHLQGALSKHVFETVLNVYGVPAGSPLVDQYGALLFGYETALSITSAGTAKQILGDNPISGETGKTAASASLSLGFLNQVADLVNGTRITEDVTRIVNSDATLASLTPEVKAALIETLVQEAGATLIKSALNQLAASIDLPGLVSQILANLSTLVLAPSETPPPQTNLKEVVSQLILSQELSKQLNISRATADRIVQNAIQELARENQIATQDAISKAILDQIRSDQALNAAVSAQSAQQSAIAADNEQTQISADAALEAEIHASVVKADEASASRVQAEQERSTRAKQDAFFNALAANLEAQQVDPAKRKRLIDIYRPTVLNALISGLIKPNFLEALTNHLIKLPMTQEEANLAATTALSEANKKDATLNPLSTFIGNQVLGLNSLSALFKVQVSHILSPVVGQRKALEVAEDYGRLIFAAPNSTTKLMELNEKHLSTLDGYNFNTRIFEDYRNAAQIFINPTAAAENPLHKGNVVLLSGPAAGLSVKGTTSADNTLGPLAFRNKNPIQG